jgi:hypothetical protein
VRLERLHRRARLEPGDAVDQRDPQDRGPRLLMHGFDRADRLRVPTDPFFDGESVNHDHHDGLAPRAVVGVRAVVLAVMDHTMQPTHVSLCRRPSASGAAL